MKVAIEYTQMHKEHMLFMRIRRADLRFGSGRNCML